MSGRERKGAGRLSRPCELFVLLGLPLEKGEKAEVGSFVKKGEKAREAAFLLMNERRKKKKKISGLACLAETTWSCRFSTLEIQTSVL